MRESRLWNACEDRRYRGPLCTGIGNRAGPNPKEHTIMSVYENIDNRQVPLGSIGIFTVVSGAEGLLGRLRDWNARRTTLRALGRLSAEQLADIGLSPADVYGLARGR